MRDIEQAFKALCEAEIPTLAEAHVNTPRTFPKLPALTMQLVNIVQTDEETGGATQNEWHWRVDVVTRLDKWEDAQEAMKDLLPQVLSVLRKHPDLSDTCERAYFRDVGTDPVFDLEEGTYYKSLTLIAEREES